LLDPLGRGGAARLRLPGAVEAARELDGCEDLVAGPEPSAPHGGGDWETAGPRGPATTAGKGGEYAVELVPYRPRAIGLRLAPPGEPLAPPRAQALRLPRDRVVVTGQGQPCPHGLGPRSVALPAETFPTFLEVGGVRFDLAAEPANGCHALACAGQALEIPAGDWEHLWLLLASGGAGRQATLRAGEVAREVAAPPALLPLARPDQVPRLGIGPLAWWWLRPGWSHDTPVAWTAGHCHDRRGRDLPYQPACLFAVSVALPPATPQVTLPTDPEILLFAATVASGCGTAIAAWNDPRSAL
jgi:hypothetical protein